MATWSELGGADSRRTGAVAGMATGGASLQAVFQHAAIINATLLKLSSLDQPGLDTRIYRSVLDAAIKELENATSPQEVRQAEQRIARSTQLHLRAREELLTAREDEYSATVEILADAMVQFKDTDTAFAESVLDRSERMKQVVAGDDLRALRTQLTKELTDLSAVTIAKQEEQARQLTELGGKVATLEAKLNVATGAARRDGLTGLFNRVAWNQRMAELAVQLEEGDNAYAVALIDLDNLGRINSTDGHVAGDEVLASFGEFCRHAFGDDDFVARFDGDEFIALISADTLEHATEHVNRLFLLLQRSNEEASAEGRTAFTISTGLVPASRRESVHALLKRADVALRAAKHAGRNRLVVAAA